MAYVSHPVLIRGSHIGEGNYNRPSGEIINLEQNIVLTDYNASAVAADATINMEAQSNGKIGKGGKAYHLTLTGQNSAADKYVRLLSASGGVKGVKIEDSLVAAKLHSNTGRQVANSDGDIYMDIEDANWTNVSIEVSAVELD